MNEGPFTIDIKPDGEGLLRCLRRQGTPARVHFIELFLDPEVEDAVCQRFGLAGGLDPADPFFAERRLIAMQRFLGYDHVRGWPEMIDYTYHKVLAPDTALLARSGGREYIDEHRGPITSWREFEEYPWPDPARITTRSLEFFQKNLPDDMLLIGGHLGHFLENLSFLMGFETLAMALFTQRDLVRAIADKIMDFDARVLQIVLQFDRVGAVWASDDMGFRTGTLISPADLREFVLPGHRAHAAAAHAAGRPYILHCCGRLDAIMPDLLDDVRIDAKHSFEDAIEPVESFKARWGDRVTALGGLDVNLLCRAGEAGVRARTRQIMEACQAGGGFALGSGNTVANYVPVENYLAMLDEGRKWGK